MPQSSSLHAQHLRCISPTNAEAHTNSKLHFVKSQVRSRWSISTKRYGVCNIVPLHAQGAELADAKNQLQAQEDAAAQSAAKLETLQLSVYDLNQQLAAASTALDDCRTAAAEEVVRAVATAEEAAREKLEVVRRELGEEAARESAQATDTLQKALDDAAANREQLLQVAKLPELWCVRIQ